MTSKSWVSWSSRARFRFTRFEKVDVHQSFWNDFFRLISVGLYRPAKTVVTCRSGARYMIGLNHQGLVEVLKQVKHAAEEGMAALPGASQTPN